MAESVPKHWTMQDVQKHLHDILVADTPLTLSEDQRKALKAVIEMSDVWTKLSPGFAAVIRQYKEKQLDVECPPGCASMTRRVCDEYCNKCKALLAQSKD